MAERVAAGTGVGEAAAILEAAASRTAGGIGAAHRPAPTGGFELQGLDRVLLLFQRAAGCPGEVEQAGEMHPVHDPDGRLSAAPVEVERTAGHRGGYTD